MNLRHCESKTLFTPVSLFDCGIICALVISSARIWGMQSLMEPIIAANDIFIKKSQTSTNIFSLLLELQIISLPFYSQFHN